jgi:hypothetical protein
MPSRQAVPAIARIISRSSVTGIFTALAMSASGVFSFTIRRTFPQASRHFEGNRIA